MERIGRLFFAMALAAFGIQQFFYGDFIPGRAPAFPAELPGRLAWAYASGAIFVICGLAIAADIKGRVAGITAGMMIFAWALLRHLPLAAADPNGITITFAGKALALFGGALAVSGSFTGIKNRIPDHSGNSQAGSLLLWTGRICLGAFLLIGGVEHFIYPQFVATLVPVWIPGAAFWTYFAGVALIAGGLGMLIPPTARLAAFLSGLMIFLWVILLHIPRAVMAADAAASRNEWTAVFEALAMSGIAFVISATLAKPR
ncbi:MAG: hypothetical protein ABI999_19130 [Acidobacteriota bacterium]